MQMCGLVCAGPNLLQCCGWPLQDGPQGGDVLGGLVYGGLGLGLVANLDFRDLDLGPWSLSLAADMVGEEWADYVTPRVTMPWHPRFLKGQTKILLRRNLRGGKKFEGIEVRWRLVSFRLCSVLAAGVWTVRKDRCTNTTTSVFSTF